MRTACGAGNVLLKLEIKMNALVYSTHTPAKPPKKLGRCVCVCAVEPASLPAHAPRQHDALVARQSG
jgi:hypothetical protein